MNNTIMTAKNTFSEGMVMDFSPDNTLASTLTSALNATLLTSNGNEMALLNDMGNGRVETAYLPEGYIPVGSCEFGDIIYVVSYNPLTNKSLIGCFPSPERNIDSNEVGLLSNIIESNAFNDTSGNIKSTRIKVELTSTKLSPGDKYIIYGTELNSNLSYYGDITHSFSPDYTGLVTLRVASIDEDNKITYLDSDLKWHDNDYYIKSGIATSDTFQDIDELRNLILSPYNIFGSKTSGKLCIIAELVTIDSFSCTWDAQVETNSEDSNLKIAKILFYTNWQSLNPKINPSYAIIKINDKDSYYSEYSNLPNRNNDGNDKDEVLEHVEYPYNTLDNLANTNIYYSVIPSMKVGLLPWLETKGSINLQNIGSGKIELNQWRYHINPDTFLLSWGLDAYPEKNKRISKVTMKFISYTGESSNNATYSISEKVSYSGYFTESIPFETSTYKLNGVIYKDSLYLVEIVVEYGNDVEKTPIYFYRWIYTNSMWNDKYLENKLDFNDLLPELELISSTKVDLFLSSQLKVVTSNLGTDAKQNLEDTLSYNMYKVLKEDNNIKVSVTAKFKDGHDIFSIDNLYISFSNTLGKSSITTSEISYVSESSILSETSLLDPILDTLASGLIYLSKRGEENDDLIDTFDIVEGDNFSNSNTFYLTCHGVTYNKATYYDKLLTLTYSSIVAPIIYNELTLLDNNMSYEYLNDQESIKFIFNNYIYFGWTNIATPFSGPRMFTCGLASLSGSTILAHSTNRYETSTGSKWHNFTWLDSDFLQLILELLSKINLLGSIIPFIFAQHRNNNSLYKRLLRQVAPDLGGIVIYPRWLFDPALPPDYPPSGGIGGSNVVSEHYPASINEPQEIGPNFVGGVLIKGTNVDTLYPINFFYSFSTEGGQTLSRTGNSFKGKTAADAIVDVLGQCYVVHDAAGSKSLYVPNLLNYLSPYTEYWNKEIITSMTLSKDNYSLIKINSIKLGNILSNVSKYAALSSKININNISPEIKSSTFTSTVTIPILNRNDLLIVNLKNYETILGSLVYTCEGDTYIDNSNTFNKGKIYFRYEESFTSNVYIYTVTKREITEDGHIKLTLNKSSNNGDNFMSRYFLYNRLTQLLEVIPSNYIINYGNSILLEVYNAGENNDGFIKDLAPGCYLNYEFRLL